MRLSLGGRRIRCPPRLATRSRSAAGIGRYLATLFSAIWALDVGALMLSDSRWPRALGWAGIAAGALFLASALPGVSFDASGPLNTLGFGIWFGWLIASGLLLAASRDALTPPEHLGRFTLPEPA
jgi:hypothetical protein